MAVAFGLSWVKGGAGWRRDAAAAAAAAACAATSSLTGGGEERPLAGGGTPSGTASCSGSGSGSESLIGAASRSSSRVHANVGAQPRGTRLPLLLGLSRRVHMTAVNLPMLRAVRLGLGRRPRWSCRVRASSTTMIGRDTMLCLDLV